MSTAFVVRFATVNDLSHLPEIERRADEVFTDVGLGPFPAADASPEGLTTARAVLVVGDPPVGYARLDEVDGQAHLEQLSVLPVYMRQGNGRALVAAAIGWARAHGYTSITLCTFRDVPWNGPYYAGLGFEPVLEFGPGLAELRRHERELGLDASGPRVVMRRRL